MKKFQLFLTCTFLLLIHFNSNAQDTSLHGKKWKVAVFTPLFLDSAFNGSLDYNYGNNFPKFLNPGLEFYEGIERAADSLSAMNVPLEIHVFDSRSLRSSVSKTIESARFKDFDLVIGHVNANEARALAQAAAKFQKPFINVNYPNDAGIQNNPYYVILNSTLDAQFKSLYRHLQRNHNGTEILYVKRKSGNDDRILNEIREVEKNTTGPAVKLKVVTLDGMEYGSQLSRYLDSNKTNVILAGSFDVNFAQNLLEDIKELGESYPVSLYGMPTWDNLDVAKYGADNISVLYGTPFYINNSIPLIESLQEEFKEKFYSRPTDMFFRGYETLMHFGLLLKEHGNNIASGLGDKKFRIFTEFDIQPVLDPKTMTLDYFENKKIYFIQKAGKEIKGVF